MLPIGNHIYFIRVQQGISQGELAVKAGLAQSNLSNIEKGKQDITVTTLRKIAYALGVPAAHFFEQDQIEKEQVLLTRPTIEKIAKAIAKKDVSLTEKEKEIVALFQQVLPISNKKKVRFKRMHRSWLELKMRFGSSEIQTFYDRVKELTRMEP